MATPPDGAAPRTRRAALARLGLAAGTLYLAPALTRLRSARADDGGEGGGDDGHGPPWQGQSKPGNGNGRGNGNGNGGGGD